MTSFNIGNGPPNSGINQESLPPNYPPLRALLSALSQELHTLKGSYCTRLIQPFNAGDSTMTVETTYGFPNEGEVYVSGHRCLYKGLTTNSLLDVIHSSDLTVLDSGDVVTLVLPTDCSGEITKAGDELSVGTASGSMLDVIGMNHNVPRYFGINDNSYRRLIRVLAYMAGRGTQPSIELFLDAILDEEGACGSGTLTDNGTKIQLITNQVEPAPFGSLLTQGFTRLDIAFVRPNNELKEFRVKVDSLTSADGEFFFDAVLSTRSTPEYSSASELSQYIAEATNGLLSCVWRVTPYRVFEDPYKRYERDANVGLSPFAPSTHDRQTVGNTVLVDLTIPQELSSIGAGYTAGKLILYSSTPQGFASPLEERLRIVGGEMRLYLEGDAVGFNIDRGLQAYMSSHPRQVLNVRRVRKSAPLSVLPSENSSDALYFPVGPNLLDSTNNWVFDGADYYVVLNHALDNELQQMFNGDPVNVPINFLQVDMGEVESPSGADPHVAGYDETGQGLIGVAGGIATAQILPSVNVRNPSFSPPSVIITVGNFPNVAGMTLEVVATTDSGTNYTQRLSFPENITMDELVDAINDVSGSSDSYIIDFMYASGYQVSGEEILGYKIFSHAIKTNLGVTIYMRENFRSFVRVDNVSNDEVDNFDFGYVLPYISPDPLVPRRQIDYYPLYLGERNILLLSLIEDIITVAGVIPEVNSRTFQTFPVYVQSWSDLKKSIVVRSL